MNRRKAIKNISMGIAGITSGVADNTFLQNTSTNQQTESDKLIVTKVDVVQFRQGHWTWVLIHTDQGIIGVGETYPLTEANEGALKHLANLVVGRNALNIESVWQAMFARASYNVIGGAEMRIISAVNIALWDILGQYLGAPVYQLLGGKVRNGVKVYNTTGHGAIQPNWTNEQHMEEIVKFLLERGITAMKIWPFDAVAGKTNGQYISPKGIEKGLDWIKRIRDTAGTDMEIAVEFHALWNLPSSIRIAKALETYGILWLEDIMQPVSIEAHKKLAESTVIPVLVSERLATSHPYLNFLKENACSIVMFDVEWCGGISSAKKIADLANTFSVPVTPHTYGGPVLWYASAHISAAVPNLYIMESGIDFYRDRFPEYLSEVMVPEDGYVYPPDKPGLGLSINPKIYKSGEASVETVAKLNETMYPLWG